MKSTSSLARDFGLCIVLVLSGVWPRFLLGEETALANWIWMGLWAPAAGSLAATFDRQRFAWAVPVVWTLALSFLVGGALHPSHGATAVTALYLLGLASGAPSQSPWSRASIWLLITCLLCALPAAGGMWADAPAAGFLSAALDASPIVWVCEHAGFDWMRHISIYERAGAGNLGPEQRMAWSGGALPGAICGLLAVITILRRSLGKRAAQAPAPQ